MSSSEPTQSIANVLQFYGLTNRLKDVIRTGWQRWHVQRERLESVAEHVYGVQMLAIVIWSEYNYQIDIQKVCFMRALHELEEVAIGDHIPFNDISREEKQRLGHEAIHKMLDGLVKQSEIEGIILEFDSQQTPEAKFAYQCDKLEAVLQCCLYDREGDVDLLTQGDNPLLSDKALSEIYRPGMSWSKLWCEYNRTHVDFDDTFRAILSTMATPAGIEPAL